MTIPLKDSTAPNAQAALARLEQLKSQLNLTPSPMSIQAPKDMAAERAAADFSIDGLARLWAGGDQKYEIQVLNLLRNFNSILTLSTSNVLTTI